MYQWACADLQATDKDFIIAIWHHPPYTKGSHNSDTEAQLIEMRQRFLPVMERYGVDLVLTGHSHCYERSVLLDGHYGLSTTYSAALHAVDAGDGDPAGDGAYVKELIGPFGNNGTVSTLTGSASQTDGGSLNHPAMEKSLNILGSMVIDVVGRQLDARMIGVSGNVLDHFQIVKGPMLPVCSDGVDQDGDGASISRAIRAATAPSERSRIRSATTALDNDSDTLVDLADPDCASASDDLEAPPPPACSDGLDNDGDTFVDFPADPGCASAASTTESPQCDDGFDNDGDTLVDLADPGCIDPADDDEFAIFPLCSDGLDNDGDLLVDFPADPGCVDAMSNLENPQCDDVLDNDADTLVDLADPDCASASDDDETAPPAACSDGLDNDGDLLVDFPADPGCVDAMSNLENPQCDDGLDNDADTLVDLADPDCASASDDGETTPPPACSDGVDNDGDELVDFPADPGCFDGAWSLENPRCDDDLDNDGDGKIDWDGGSGGGTPDPQCATAYKKKETACGLGFELAIVVPVLAILRRRRRRAA